MTFREYYEKLPKEEAEKYKKDFVDMNGEAIWEDLLDEDICFVEEVSQDGEAE